ncbi:SH3 domain-containing protein [Acetobacteraceae bacterium ESL0709]|nr:SH3 domain-containing protein [Acetobacteraceae bacterium ESL0697]MDF7677855.1 SH3 domain-containing protein [Acetobacteraceae bacterium ESL0709]
MKLLHPVFDRLSLMGASLLFVSGLACVALGPEAMAQAGHHQASSKARHHKKPLARPVSKYAAKKHVKAKKNGKLAAKPVSKAPVVAGAAAGAATAATAAALAKPAQPELEKGTDTGYPIPRFASLRADRVYMRRGPGERYPIDWVYHRRGLPVKIEREFDVWRLVEDSEGQKGWVHRVTLRGNRTFLVPGGNNTVAQDTKNSFSKHADPSVIAYITPQELSHQKGDQIYLFNSTAPDQKVVALLKAGVVGQIIACPDGSAWCHVKVADYEGWVQRKEIWGLFPDENIQPK